MKQPAHPVKAVVKPPQTLSAQLALFEPNSLEALRISQVVREPLDMLIEKLSRHSLVDWKIYFWILSKISSLQHITPEEGFQYPRNDLEFCIPVSELHLADVPEKSSKKKFVSDSYNYTYFKKITKDIVARSIIQVDHMESLDPRTRQVGSLPIFTRCTYQDGVFTVNINQFIMPALLTLGKGFVQYKRESVFLLNAFYSVHLYIRLCRFLDKHHWRVSLTELRSLLKAETYDRYSNFKQRVLTPAVQEINDRTDIIVTVEEVFSGTGRRAVVGLEFKMHTKASRHPERVQARREISEITEFVTQQPISVRRQQAAQILARDYTFTAEQNAQILAQEAKLNEFIRLENLISSGLLAIRTTPTRYMATILFSTKKRSVAPPKSGIELDLG